MTLFTVQIDNPGRAELTALIAQLDNYLNSLYPPESNHLMGITALQGNDVVFLSCKWDDRYVGCGAIRFDKDGYGEIKRMFVSKDFRRQRIGLAIMAEIEKTALRRGLSVLRLETGIYQDEAMSLYEKMGYLKRAPFGAYNDDPFSVFYEKNLLAPNPSSQNVPHTRIGGLQPVE